MPLMNPGPIAGSPLLSMRLAPLLPNRTKAFSLIELLIVMGIIVLMAALAGPAMNTIRGGGDFTSAASDISDALQQARAYAMAKNSYVYVGIMEADASKDALTAGTGRIAVALVASKDGSRPTTLDATTTVPISRLQKFDNAHIATTTLNNDGNMERPTGNTDVTNLAQNDSVSLAWPNAGASTNFQKVIEFDPQGVARYPANLTPGSTTSKAIVGWIEIPLVPSHGSGGAGASEKNMAAIQVDGMTGAVRVYRP